MLSCLPTSEVSDLIFSQFSIDCCQKCVCFRGSAPGPAGGLMAPPNPSWTTMSHKPILSGSTHLLPHTFTPSYAPGCILYVCINVFTCCCKINYHYHCHCHYHYHYHYHYHRPPTWCRNTAYNRLDQAPSSTNIYIPVPLVIVCSSQNAGQYCTRIEFWVVPTLRSIWNCTFSSFLLQQFIVMFYWNTFRFQWCFVKKIKNILHHITSTQHQNDDIRSMLINSTASVITSMQMLYTPNHMHSLQDICLIDTIIETTQNSG